MPNEPILIALLAVVGAVAAAATATRRPLVALGILFVLASTSRVTLDTPVGTMRLEQPAIACVALVLLATGRWRRLLEVRGVALLVALGFALYLGVLAVSSALIAPQPIESLRLVAWLAISMVGGAVAFLLAWPDPDAAVLPFAFGGALKGAIGIAVAVLYLVGGPGADIGIQEANGILPRVHAFTWEANLYASLLAMCVPFALEVARGPGRRGLLLLGLVAIGLPLGMTRGAYVGLAAGLIVYAAILLVAERRSVNLWRLGAATGVFLAVGLLGYSVLLPNLVERATGVEVLGVVVLPVATAAPPGPGSSGGPGASGGPGRTASPTPLPSLQPYPDTVGFRLERVPVAFDDLRGSPIIGLGAESYGQRHGDSTQAGAPDHIAILAVAALYDAGVVGAGGLVLAFAALLLLLWRRAQAAGRLGDRRRLGSAAAYDGTIVAMLVCYEATNALHFAINWLIIGAAAAIAVSRATADLAGAAAQPPESATR